MKAPVSWLTQYAQLGEDVDARGLGEALIRAGLEVETVEAVGDDVTGPLVVGRVLEFVEEPQKNGKTIRWCTVDVGAHNPEGESGRGIVCGARNFAVDDLVVVSLPGAVLPGGFAIASRKTYGHVSDGMICAASELGLPEEDGGGIMILTEDVVAPGDDVLPLLDLRDDVLDIAVTPDRGDCFSIRGLAREAAISSGVGFDDPVDRPVPTEVTAGPPVRRDDPACPLFVALRVNGIDPQARSPRWLARAVQLAGMRPISLAVDVTNYVMLATGQPLHAYDRARLSGAIQVRRAVAGEKLTTLDDQVRDLDPADLVIADDSGPIGLAGVMGGASTEIGPETTEVVLEAAHFDATTVARTSRRHKLGSEASRRFERGVDPAATYAAAHLAARLLVELAGGELVAEETVSGAVPSMSSVTIDADLPGRILGAEIGADQVVEFLQRIGCTVSASGESGSARIEVVPPTWRPDLTDPYDLVEEVGRQVGLDTIEPVLPTPPAGGGHSPRQRVRRALQSALPAAGFTEILTFPFVSGDDIDQLGVAEGDRRRRLVKLANPLAETSPYLRTCLVPGLLHAAARNLSRGNDDLALYESGLVFLARPDAPAAPRPSVAGRPSDAERAALDAALPEQPERLGVVLTGQWRPAGWSGPAEPVAWTHAVAFVETAARAVGVELARVADHDHAPWHPGRCARFELADGTVVGHAGELHPSVAKEFGLPARSCAAEVDLEVLVAAAPDGGDVASLNTLPVAKEDVALVVDAAVPAAAVQASLREGAGELLESVRLFDVYSGEQVGEGKKSLAFALKLRGDHTLTDAEAAAVRDAAVAKAATDHGAVQRA
ncbi:MAG TPA: phenylalanine--tRNA ligase subunit beta [Candidatus Avipropionibacterium avicola]|uniref:Phenylalanine--tRNA ligase beta subunit n=1 Tax=Candidatus Avipropionibacterium avicola TaxID=2840701 RepID=A0A9D1KLN7_9ACTN|nr:phenylalanine--tRNA ligase subunit beta [Candidatus Avipropionibacterium avicola]